MPATGNDTFSRYLPPDPQSTRWGWRLIDAGRQHVPPGSPYPLAGHPLAYAFDKNGRRTLGEFQLVLVERERTLRVALVPRAPGVRRGHAAALSG